MSSLTVGAIQDSNTQALAKPIVVLASPNGSSGVGLLTWHLPYFPCYLHLTVCLFDVCPEQATYMLVTIVWMDNRTASLYVNL